jgi:putative endonuclease
MASHSTRPVNHKGLAHGKPLDSQACGMKTSHAAGHSNRKLEAQGPDGPRRMALSERTLASESKGKTLAPVSTSCFVYILECSDGSYYIGATSDPLERERIHNEGYGSEHTARRLPVRLVYSEDHPSWPAARTREAQLKRWSHAKKMALIDGDRERLHALAKRRA